VIVTKNGVSTKPSIYPVTIARARYHGDYEGASWVCFPLTVKRLTEESWSRWDDADERECQGFWNGARAQELLIGLGDSPTAAYDNLIELACARRCQSRSTSRGTSLMLSACGGQDQVATGTVTGSLVRVGGPIPLGLRLPPAPVPLPGRVIAESTDGSRYTASVDTSGHYTISLPPGTYQLTGYSPLVRADGAEMQCHAAHAVQVTAGTTTTGIDVICSIR
jgi:hypothetical protein